MDFCLRRNMWIVTKISSKAKSTQYSNKSAVKTVLMKMMKSDGNFCYNFADRNNKIEKIYHRILIKKSIQVKTEMKNKNVFTRLKLVVVYRRKNHRKT